MSLAHMHGVSSDKGFVRIKRIRMVGFRSFQDYTLELPSGLVFVCGPNESGKTGIMKAVQLGLFTDAGTTRQDVRRLARWGNGQGFRIELTLDTQDGQWEIVRDFETGTNILTKPDGTRERDKHKISEIVARLLGFPQQGAEPAYTASLCVLQDELASGPGDLQKLIEVRILGAGVDVVKLANEAQRRISELKAGQRGGTRQGELTLARMRVHELEDRLRDVTTEVQKAQDARTKLLSVTQQIDELRGQIAVLEQMQASAKAYAKAKSDYEREKGEFEVVNDLKHKRELLMKRLEELEPEVNRLTQIKAELDSEILRKRRLQQIERDVGLAKSEVARLSDLRDKAVDLIGQAEEAEADIKGLALIDPEKVKEAVKLYQSLAHHVQSLDQARSDYEEFQEQLAGFERELKLKSEHESRLSRILQTTEQAEKLDSVSGQAKHLEQAIRQYEAIRARLSVLVPVSGEHVKQAVALAYEIDAMNQMPAGLDVEIIPAPGVRANLSLDGGPFEKVEPGHARFSAVKRAEVVVPGTVDIKVSTTDSEQYLVKLRESQDKLGQILGRYGVATPDELSQAFDEYRNLENQLEVASQRLHGQVSAADLDVSKEDLSTAAKRIAAQLRMQAQAAEQAVIAGLAALDMDLDKLKGLHGDADERELQAVRREVRDLERDISGLKAKIDVLKTGEKQETIESIRDSIDSIVRQAGCTSLNDMVAKAEQIETLQARAKDMRSRAQDLLGNKSVSLLDAEVSSFSQSVLSMEKEQQDLLAAGPVPEDLEERLESIEHELKAKQSERDQIEGQIKGINEAKLEHRESRIIVGLALATREMDENVHYRMSAEEMVKAEIELAGKRQLFEQLGERKSLAEAALNLVTRGAEDIAAVAEELDYAKKQLEHIEREIRILEILRDAFPEARTRAVSGMLDLLSDASSKYIQRMTNGKYTRMEISEDFGPLLHSESRGKPIHGAQEKELLSSGTADQVLFAVRLGVADLLSQGKCPPMIMDDPFIHFDAARRQAAIEILKEVSGWFQVIVLTCHDYREIPEDQKVRLPVVDE